ncbi:MAG TPA: DUF427 domain-containing protein [Acidimicrobiales bacterium]|nr:DUF427 domain-containing protein [Acidimicrobiales bacterium]
MAEFESAWLRRPDYRIDVVPQRRRVRAWLGDVLLAESDSCLVVDEQDHLLRMYFPKADVRLDLFSATDHHTICPFKGEAEYWTLTASDPPLENVVWAYPTPLPETEAIRDHLCFYEDRVRVELVDDWPDGAVSVHRFPAWGDAADLLRLVDVQPGGEGRFSGPAYPTPRNVVEGSQMLAQAIVAASKSVPGQRVTSAFMTYPKSASFDAPLEFHVEVLRRGRTFSTVEVRTYQDGVLRAPGLFLADSGARDVIRGQQEMPKVPGPEDAEPYDMRVTGRDLRIVDGAYSPDPDKVGPPEIYAWMRFRDDPGEQHLRDALLAQATGHWTIGAAMLPHPGFGEADAHVTLSTGIMSISIAFHDEAPLDQWFLYANPAIHAGGGLAQGDGRVFSQDGRLMASYSVQAMIRKFDQAPSTMGLDESNAM